jgi:hypothetical protein
MWTYRSLREPLASKLSMMILDRDGCIEYVPDDASNSFGLSESAAGDLEASKYSMVDAKWPFRSKVKVPFGLGPYG